MVTAVVFELALLAYDWYKADNSNLTKEQYWEVMMKRICAAVCSMSCSWFVCYIGGMIPVTICGSASSAVLVSILFTMFAGVVCDCLGKAVGVKFAEVVKPVVERLLSEAKDKMQ